MAEKFKLPFFETSALDGKNVDAAFESIGKSIVEDIEDCSSSSFNNEGEFMRKLSEEKTDEATMLQLSSFNFNYSLYFVCFSGLRFLHSISAIRKT